MLQYRRFDLTGTVASSVVGLRRGLRTSDASPELADTRLTTNLIRARSCGLLPAMEQSSHAMTCNDWRAKADLGTHSAKSPKYRLAQTWSVHSSTVSIALDPAVTA
jgi:hypothetical protein